MANQSAAIAKISTLHPHHEFNLKTAIELDKFNYPKRDWLLSPWLRQRMLVMVHAPTGVGKSWFAWSVAIGIASGKGYAQWTSPSAGKVLIIDGEMQPDDLQDRARFLRKSFKLSKPQLNQLKHNLVVLARQDQDPDIEFPDLNEPDDQDRFLEVIREVNPDLVILDNLSTLANLEDENAAHAFNNIFRFLTKIKQERSGMLVHHDRKGTDKDTTEGYRGSSKMAAIFEQRIHLSQVHEGQKPKDTGACFYCNFKKNRYLSDDSMKTKVFALHTKLGWIIEEDENEELKNFAAAVRACNFTTLTEVGRYFGHKRAWASKQNNKCVIQGYLEPNEYIACCDKAKQKLALDEMDEKDLNKLSPNE